MVWHIVRPRASAVLRNLFCCCRLQIRGWRVHHQPHIPRTHRSFLDTFLAALYTYTMAISNLSSTIVEPTRSRSKHFNGVIPAVVSPHDGNDNFCAQSFARQIEFLY